MSLVFESDWFYGLFHFLAFCVKSSELPIEVLIPGSLDWTVPPLHFKLEPVIQFGLQETCWAPRFHFSSWWLMAASLFTALWCASTCFLSLLFRGFQSDHTGLDCFLKICCTANQCWDCKNVCKKNNNNLFHNLMTPWNCLEESSQGSSVCQRQ